MAHIYVYSPSGAVRDRAAFRRGVKRLQAMGHEVEIDADALASFERFAGDDAIRLAAIGRAAASGADVALTTRGGYGISRLLPSLPYKALTRAVAKGTRFVGISDFTALQLALLAKTGTPTWAGPALCPDFGVAGEPDEIMEACFKATLETYDEESKANPKFKKIYDDWKVFRNNQAQWFSVAEQSYAKFAFAKKL